MPKMPGYWKQCPRITSYNVCYTKLLRAISGLLLVVLGAFGAHALESRLSAGHLIWWQKAVNYQGLHTLASYNFV